MKLTPEVWDQSDPAKLKSVYDPKLDPFYAVATSQAVDDLHEGRPDRLPGAVSHCVGGIRGTGSPRRHVSAAGFFREDR